MSCVTKTEGLMKGTGKMIFVMDMAESFTQMEIPILVSLRKVKLMEKVVMSGQMVSFTKGFGLKVLDMAMESGSVPRKTVS